MIRQLHEFRNKFKKVILENFCNFENIIYDDETICTAVINNCISGFTEFNAIVVVQNTLETLNYICKQNLHNIVINEDFYCFLNNKITYGALDQDLYGVYRNHPVHIYCVPHSIKVPDKNEVNNLVNSFNNINKNDYKYTVAKNMLQLMKLQPFENGNKRTTLFLTNCGLIKNDIGILYFTKSQYKEFKVLLADYYNDWSDEVINYVKDNCFHEFTNKQGPSTPPKSSKKKLML